MFDFRHQLAEHLKNHWKTWNDHANEKNSISINQAAYDEIQHILAPTARSAEKPKHALPAINPIAVSQQVRSGTSQSRAVEVVHPWQLSHLILSHSTLQSAVQYTYGAGGQPATGAASNVNYYAPPGSDGRAVTASTPSRKVIKLKKPRSCPRCHRVGCDGAFKSRPCSVPIQVRVLQLTIKFSSTNPLYCRRGRIDSFIIILLYYYNHMGFTIQLVAQKNTLSELLRVSW